MPFKSEKQRRFLHANEPEIAKRWERDYENEEGTHPGYEDTTWSDGEVTITMQDVENKLTELKAPVISIPVEDITHLDIHTRHKPNKTPGQVKSTYDRAMKADLKYPIIITKYNGKYDMILDGNHRLHKAVEIGEDSIQAKVLDLSKTPDWLSVFGDEEIPAEDAEKVDKDRMKCNSPRRTSGGSKKFVVKACKDGKEKIVRFGDPNMRIKKSNPKRRKSFRARHKCDQKKDKFSAGYWSCKKW